MAPTANENLLAKLARGDDGEDQLLSFAASEPEHEEQEDEKLNELLARINQKMDDPNTAGDAPEETQEPDEQDAFVPVEPESFREAGLTDTEVEALILKYLMARGDASGHDVADQIRLPFVLVDGLLRQLKADQLVVHKGSAPMNDYQYQLSDIGRERARRYHEQCSYFGSAPVILKDYIAGVKAQSLAGQRPTADAMHAAFEDLLLNKKMLDRLGPRGQLRARSFPFRPSGQRQDQHRRTGHGRFRQTRLDSQVYRCRRHDRSRFRSHQPRRSPGQRTLRVTRQPQDRQTLGPDRTPHHHRRR